MKYIDSIKKFFIENVKLLLISFIIGILIHGYKIVNYLPTWDSMFFMKTSYLTMLETGRWLSGIVSVIFTSSLDLHYLQGLLSIGILSIVAVLILDILEIKNNRNKVIAIILFMVFPTTTSLLCYMNWAPVYSLSYLMAILAVYLSIKGEDNILNKIIICLLICCSLGIYQIFVTSATILFIYYYIREVMKGSSLFDYKKNIISYVICGLIGCIIYYVILKVILSVTGQNLTDYQGVSTFGKVSASSMVKSLVNVIVSFIVFHTGGKRFSFYLVINILVLLFVIGIWIKNLFFNKKVKHKVQVILLLVVTIFISYIFLIFSNDTYYHMIMQTGNYYIYIGALMLYEMYDKKGVVIKYFIVLVCVLSFYHFMNANKAYKEMEVSYSRTYYLVSNTLSKIDNLSDNGEEEVIIIGDCFYEDIIMETIPKITGADPATIIRSPYHFKEYAKYYFDRDYNISNHQVIMDSKEIEKYISMDEFNNMDVYPYGDYVIKKGNYIIVRFPM